MIEQSILINYIKLGYPQQNAYVKRYRRTIHYDWLNQELFTDLDQIRKQTKDWSHHYNNARLNMHSSSSTLTQKLNQAV